MLDDNVNNILSFSLVRCASYPNLAANCVMVPDSNDPQCCQAPYCHNQNTTVIHGVQGTITGVGTIPPPTVVPGKPTTVPKCKYCLLTVIIWFWFGFMMFNATFNNISVISFFLVEETGENHRQVTDTLSHNVVSSTPRKEQDLNSQL